MIIDWIRAELEEAQRYIFFVGYARAVGWIVADDTLLPLVLRPDKNS